MKIKKVKKLNLPELIEHVWENKDYPSVWGSKESTSDEWTIQFFEDGMFRSYNGFHDYDTFKVMVEEELTEDTVIHGLADVFFDPLVGGPKVEFYADCIKNIKQDAMETYSLAIFYKDTLVWSRESGIPESGVLEVE